MTANDPVFSIDADILDKLLFAHDGDMALLYLYELKNPDSSQEDAAGSLCRTLNEIASASEKLSRIISSSPAVTKPSEPQAVEVKKDDFLYPPPEEFPQYTVEEITRRGSTDPTFQALIDEAKRITGGFLSESFTRALFGIYDYLNLPPEVIYMLLNYCGEIAAGRPNKRKLSSRDLEREAYRWYNNGAVTLEAAEEYLQNQKERRSVIGRVKAVLNIAGRALTKTEQEFITAWLDMGFDENAIAIAYDRTVTNVGFLKWPYMNKILLSWHEKKLHTAESIESGDTHSKPASSSGGGFTDEELVSLLGKLTEE